MRTLYPALEPYDHGYLPPDGEHAVYYEQCGNPEGNPAVFVHGGPGGGSDSESKPPSLALSDLPASFAPGQSIWMPPSRRAPSSITSFGV